MQCDHCGKSDAVIHFTQIVDNEMSTFHLCEACAEKKGLDASQATANVPLTDFLAQMGKSAGPPDPEPSTRCSFCGLRLERFRKSGRVGCSQCYVSFEPHLKNLLRRLHGGTQHVGKVYLPPDPSDAERGERLAGLRRRLTRAVESEDFERAAQIRDQIRALEIA